MKVTEHVRCSLQRDDSTNAIRMLQEQMGHTSIATTMRYRKISGEGLKDWYRRLCEKRDNG